MGEKDFRQDGSLGEDNILGAAWRSMAEAADVDSHPDLDLLLRYHLGELEAVRAAKVRGHIAGCIECTEALVDFEDFAATTEDTAARPEADPVTDDDVADLWRGIKTQLAQEGDEASRPRTSGQGLETAGAPVLASPSPWAPRPPWATWAQQAAAVVLLACGLSVGILRWATPSAGPEAWASLPLAQVKPVETTVRGGELLQLGPGDADEWLLLDFGLPSTATFERYVAELQGPDGENLLTSPEIVAQGPFLIPLVQRKMFPIGRTTVRLYGLDGESRELVGTYQIERRTD